jgi:hypothetical protein
MVGGTSALQVPKNRVIVRDTTPRTTVRTIPTTKKATVRYGKILNSFNNENIF